LERRSRGRNGTSSENFEATDYVAFVPTENPSEEIEICGNTLIEGAEGWNVDAHFGKILLLT
jgi:hypothetical protein